MSQQSFQLGSAHFSNTGATRNHWHARQSSESPSIHDSAGRNDSTHACVRFPADITPRPYPFTRGDSRLRPTKIGNPPLHALLNSQKCGSLKTPHLAFEGHY
eukprot:1873547-Rhodomonas_salina.2